MDIVGRRTGDSHGAGDMGMSQLAMAAGLANDDPTMCGELFQQVSDLHYQGRDQETSHSESFGFRAMSASNMARFAGID